MIATGIISLRAVFAFGVSKFFWFRITTLHNSFEKTKPVSPSGQSQRTQAIQWKREARQNMCERMTIGFGFTSGWREFFKLIVYRSNPKPISFRHLNENRSMNLMCPFPCESAAC